MKHVNFAIFGTGTMAEIYARIIMQRTDSTLKGFIGNTSERTSQIAAAFNVPSFANSDYQKIFSEVGEVDAVIIATPEWVREKPLQVAISNKVHILLEKPFADSWSVAVQFEKMLKSYPKTFDICHVLRYSPRLYAMKRAIDRGEIGSIRHIYSRRNSNNQRVLRVLGKTNVAFWLAPHDVDMILWIAPSKIKRIYAITRDKAKTNDDYLIVNMLFESGLTAVLEISWCGPPVSGSSREAVFEVRGNAGNIEVEDYAMNITIYKQDMQVVVEDTYEDYNLHNQYRGYFFELVDDFVRKMRNNGKNNSDLETTMETTRICEMIRLSVENESIVERNDII